MIEFGKSLRAAREAKGFTIGQIAEKTHMAPSTITDLEAEDFTRIAAPIYGRGFVKLYCETVGLESKPFVDEFMAIYSGNRDIGIKERPIATTSEPVTPAAEPVTPDAGKAPQPDPLPKPTAAPEPIAGEEPPFRLESQTIPAPPPPSEPPQRMSREDLFAQASAMMRENSAQHGDSSYARYAAPMHQLKPYTGSSIWRLAILAILALALFALIAFGVRTIYRATTTAPVDPTPDPAPIAKPAPVADPEPKPAAKPTAKPAAKPTAKPAAKPTTKPATKPVPATATKKTARKPQKIPSLYIN